MKERACQRAGTDGALADWMQELLEKYRSIKDGAAIGAAVVLEGKLLAAACAGTRGWDESRTELGDLFNIGSVSKIYVTAAVMKLVREGRLSLDRPVADYLPDWRLADKRYREITVGMLLNHSSGIPGTNEHSALRMPAGAKLYTGLCRNTDAYWGTVKLRAKPGSFSSYGNDGFDLAAQVVEAVVNEPYIDWLRANITGPLGLDSTGVGAIGTAGRCKVACKGMQPEYYNCFGAGAIHTTLTDCAMFGYLFVDGSFLGRTSVQDSSCKGIFGQDDLARTRIPQGRTFLKGAFDASNYCLGWDSLYTRNRIPLGEGAVIKDGGTEQFESYLLVSPARRLSMAICMTRDCGIFLLEVLEKIGERALRGSSKPRQLFGEAGPVSAGPVRETQSAAVKAAVPIPEDIEEKYSGIAYGSSSIYRFFVEGQSLQCMQYAAEGCWSRLEELCGLYWDGECFKKDNVKVLSAEVYGKNTYYIRMEYGIAFCQKNALYPPAGPRWQNIVGRRFYKKTQDAVFGTVCLEEIWENSVLVFTTDHEDYKTVPLLCDSGNETETCLISETDRDGICFFIKDTPSGLCLYAGEDCYF